MSVAGPSQVATRHFNDTPVRHTSGRTENNAQKYIQIITHLKDELLLQEESQAILLEDLHDFQDANFTLSQDLHRCQRSNLNIVDELQACQTANTILRDELSKMESQKRQLAKRMTKYKDASRILKREIAHRQSFEEQTRSVLQGIQEMCTTALNTPQDGEQQQQDTSTRRALDNVVLLIADHDAMFDACCSSDDVGTTTTSRSNSSSSGSTSLSLGSVFSSASNDGDTSRKTSVDEADITTNTTGGNDFNSTSKACDSYVVINEAEEAFRGGNLVIPEIIIDSSACDDNNNNNTDGIHGPIRLADYAPNLFDQKIQRILRDTSPSNPNTPIKGTRRHLCACLYADCIHVIHGEYEFITEEV